jgi:hypothetical protein
MRYAVIDTNNKLTNTVVWDGVAEFDVSPNILVLITEGMLYGFGWEWNGSEFVEPVVVEPEA